MTTHSTVELRRQVVERAGNCCEYCLLPQELAASTHQVDYAITEKYGGQTVIENLVLSYTMQCEASSLWDEKPSCTQVLDYFQGNFNEADNTTLAIGTFSETIRSSQSDDRQRCRGVFLPDSLFKGVRIVHVTVVRQEYHAAGLGKPPHCPIIAVYRQAHLAKRYQFERAEIQPSFG